MKLNAKIKHELKGFLIGLTVLGLLVLLKVSWSEIKAWYIGRVQKTNSIVIPPEVPSSFVSWIGLGPQALKPLDLSVISSSVQKFQFGIEELNSIRKTDWTRESTSQNQSGLLLDVLINALVRKSAEGVGRIQILRFYQGAKLVRELQQGLLFDVGGSVAMIGVKTSNAHSIAASPMPAPLLQSSSLEMVSLNKKFEPFLFDRIEIVVEKDMNTVKKVSHPEKKK